MSSIVDVAWAAGLFEGEGCFDCKCGALRPRASMQLTDLDVLQKFVKVVGTGTIRTAKRKHAHHKPTWQWYTDERGFRKLLSMFRPFLGKRRLATAEDCVARRAVLVAEVTKSRTCATCGVPFIPKFNKVSRRRKYCSTACCAARPKRTVITTKQEVRPNE